MSLLNHCCRARRADRFAVHSAIDFATDAPHFIEHAKTVARKGNRAVWVVIPADRNLAQAQPSKLGQVNQFNVKAKPINLRAFDQWPADIHTKSFEPALRVPERQTCRQTDDQIENASALFAAPGLV